MLIPLNPFTSHIVVWKHGDLFKDQSCVLGIKISMILVFLEGREDIAKGSFKIEKY